MSGTRLTLWQAPCDAPPAVAAGSYAWTPPYHPGQRGNSTGRTLDPGFGNASGATHLTGLSSFDASADPRAVPTSATETGSTGGRRQPRPCLRRRYGYVHTSEPTVPRYYTLSSD
jgi:hypothetical protein